MKSVLLASTLLAAVGVTPAYAANTALIMWNSADPLGAETATGTGSAAIATSNLDGITITLSNVTRGTGPNQLTEGNINVDNTDSTPQTLKIIAGANGFLGPNLLYDLTGTIGVTSGMADFAVEYAADGANTLNGQTETLTGVEVNNFDTGSLTGPFSVSKNLIGTDFVNGPYGMAEELTLTLQPGAQVFVQGASMTASGVPEPRTWAMMLMGFALMGWMGFKRSRSTRFAV